VGENDIDLEPDQFGGDLGEALAASLCPANLDRDIATVDPTKFAQPPNESGKQLAAARRRGRAQEPNGRQLAHLLRPRRERPGCGAADERDELAPSHLRGHSITSSARTRSVGGTSKPRAFAVFKLRTVSYLVGASTGRSAGLAPRRIRST